MKANLLFFANGLGILLLVSTSEARLPKRIEVSAYRTEVSPGSPEEDVLFLSRLIPRLASEFFKGPEPSIQDDFQTIEVVIDRQPARDRAGNLVLDAGGRPVISADPHLLVMGDSFLAAVESFLFWRKGFETQWIRSATPEEGEIPPTPLQRVFSESRLTEEQKLNQILAFYRSQILPRRSAPTPRPDFWPLSPVIEIKELGVQIQFNMRAGKVIILQPEVRKVWQLPFSPRSDPDDWIYLFKRFVKEDGIEIATEKMRVEAIRWANREIEDRIPAP